MGNIDSTNLNTAENMRKLLRADKDDLVIKISKITDTTYLRELFLYAYMKDKTPEMKLLQARAAELNFKLEV